jgi:PII-like signaling protein
MGAFMKTYPKKEVRIICEAPILKRLQAHLDRAAITGYTIIPAIGGRGSEGTWSREGLIGDAGQMVVVVVILDAAKLDALVDDLYDVISGQIGVMSISDVEVVRSDRF